jgi:hypothetical protein
MAVVHPEHKLTGPKKKKNTAIQEELQPGHVFISHLFTATNNKESLDVFSSYISLYLFIYYLFIYLLWCLIHRI